MPNLLLFAAFVISLVAQPQGARLYVSDLPDQATIFSEVLEYQTLGLLAHDYRAGAYFKALERFDVFELRYADQRSELYYVTDIEIFSGAQSERAIYDRMYKSGGVILQTCEGSGWYFVRARELEQVSCDNCEKTPFY